MYKSSPLTFIFKYIFPVFMTAGGLFGILIFYQDNDPSSRYFIYGFTAAFLWILLFLVQMPFRLRTIVANEDNIVLKNMNSEEIIDYKDIYWVAKFDLAGPWFMTLKYRDKMSSRDRKVCYISDSIGQSSFSEDQMSNFIKEKIEKLSTRYSKDEVPTITGNLIKGFVLSLPFTLTMLYFMAKSMDIF